jgi:hypothetical protein
LLVKNYFARWQYRWQYKGQDLKTRLHRSWFLIIKVFSSLSIMLRLYFPFLVFSFISLTFKDKSDFLWTVCFIYILKIRWYVEY